MALRVVAGCVTLRVPYDRLGTALDATRALVSRGHRVVLDLTPPGAADLAVVDALARLSLHARRSPGTLDARGDAALQDLLRLVGLGLPLIGPSLREVGRQPEPGEDGVTEEVVDVGDPPR